MIDFVANGRWFGRGRRCRQAGRPICRQSYESRQYGAENHGQSPSRDTVQTIAPFNVFNVVDIIRCAGTRGEIAAASEAHKRLQDKVNSGQQPQGDGGVAPSWRRRAHAEANRRGKSYEN
jgi:hypothetical protein